MQKTRFLTVLVLLGAFVFSACSFSADGEPTPDVGQIQTLAVMTYQAQLTQTASVLPTITALPTNTPIPVVTFASPESVAATPLVTHTPLANAQPADCYGLSYVRDVTIPDNTPMTPGQDFTKTWLVSNTGTCDWESGFVFNVVGGDAMSGVAATLNQTVQPGRQYEFSIHMIAPTDQTGEIRGTWRLADANGNFFGDGVYVLIEVGGAASTPTP